MNYKFYFLLLCSFVGRTTFSSGQCPDNNSSVGTIDASTLTVGNRTTITTGAWGGEYSLLNNMVAGETYTLDFCSQPDDTYLTVYSNSGGAALAFNDNGCGDDGQLDFNPPSNGSYRVLLDIGAGCGSNTTNHSMFITRLNILPLTLVGFSGQSGTNFNKLQWTTAQEQNTSHFEIQRSTDGMIYRKVGRVTAAGNSNSNRNYSYTDDASVLNAGIFFYRLKMIDIDEKFKYSPVIKLRPVSAGFSVEVSPNPFKQQLFVQVDALEKQSATLQLTGISGKLILLQRATLVKGNNIIEIEKTGALKSGLFLLTIYTNREKQTFKVYKQE